ncbi:unnamed protein product, partial [Mycena citricolor]
AVCTAVLRKRVAPRTPPTWVSAVTDTLTSKAVHPSDRTLAWTVRSLSDDVAMVSSRPRSVRVFGAVPDPGVHLRQRLADFMLPTSNSNLREPEDCRPPPALSWCSGSARSPSTREVAAAVSDRRRT